MSTNKQHIQNIFLLWKFAKEEIEGMSKFLILDNINDQFYRRLLIKNTFSVIETYLNVTKEIILHKVLLENSNLLSWEELAILSDKAAKLNDKGKARVSDNFQSFEPSFRFTMSTYARIFGAEPPDLGDTNFVALLRLLKLRNSITHPKVSSILEVSAKEINDAVAVFDWFIKLHSQINTKFFEWLRKITDNE